MTKKLIVMLLLAAALVSAAAAAGAHSSTPDPRGPVQIILAPQSAQDKPAPAITTAPALAAANGPVQFQSDFSSADLSAWTARPWMPTDDPARWAVVAGRLQQEGDHNGSPSDGPAAFVGPEAGSDFQLDAALLPVGGEPVGLAWHATDAGYDRVLFDSAAVAGTGVSIRIEHVTGTEGTPVAQQTSSIWSGWTTRQWFLASVRVSGANVTVLVNGQPVLTTQMAAGTGRAGVFAIAQGYSAFDNVRLQQPTTTMPTGPAGSPLTHTAPAAAPDVPAVPDSDSWSRPINISNSQGGSSGQGGIAALSTGAVMIGWTEFTSQFKMDVNHNNSLGGAMVGIDTLDTMTTNGTIISPHVVKDNLNRVHFIWAKQNSDASSDIHYARWENGQYTRNGIIPVASSPAGTPRKNTGIAVDQTGRVHIVWGRDSESLFYSYSDDGINWAPRSSVPWISGVFNISVGVTLSGQAFVGWIDRGPDPDGDVLVAARQPDGNWDVTDISSAIAPGGVGGYPHNTVLVGSPDGGMRAAWDDSAISGLEDPDVPADRPNNDIYYREWNQGIGWDNRIYQVCRNSGDSQYPAMTIDSTGVAHLTWSDPSNSDSYRVWYGRGNANQGFIGAYSLIPYIGDAYSKESAIDYGGPAVHVSYTQVLNGDKDRFYIYMSAVAPPTATNTPTNTPTDTPIPTVTPRCLGQTFADVCPGDFFYPYVTHLSTEGAISGYTCGGPGEPCYAPGNPPYFRPYNNITRAQVAKVVQLAYNIPDAPPVQMFQDVPNTNPFFTYVNALGNLGVISGYGCGGPGEPCYPGNLPYFRPNNYITRGQVSKVVVNSRGWTPLNPLTPTFHDEPRTDAFYTYVETAFAAGIVSGYSSAPPCPGLAPCFLTYNNITRGQASKMIDLGGTQSPPSPTPTSTPTVVVTATPTGTAVPANTATTTPVVTTTSTPVVTATATRTVTATATP